MISPTEVANMAFVPTDASLNDTTQFYVQMAAQEKARRDAAKLQREQQMAKFNTDLLDRIAATNTSADEVLIDEGRRIIDDIAQYSKNNRRASQSELSEYARQALAPYLAKQEMAKSVFGQFDKGVADLSKMYPYINTQNLKKDFAKEVLYNEEGVLRSMYNMGALQDPKFDLSNIENLERYAEDAALDPILQKAFKEGLQPQTGVYSGKDKDGKLVEIKYGATPLERLSEDLSQVELNTDIVNVNGKNYEVLKPNVSIPLADREDYKIRKMRLVRQLKEQDPNLADAPKEFIDALADTELAKRYGKSEKSGVTDVDYRRQEELERAERERQRLAMQQKRLSLAEQSFAMRKKKFEQDMRDEPYSPKGVYATIVAGTSFKDGEPMSQEAKNIVASKYATPFDNNVWLKIKDKVSPETKSIINRHKREDGKVLQEKVKPLVKMADLSASVKDGMFFDRKTLKPYKLIAVYENVIDTNPIFVKKYFKKITDINTQKESWQLDEDNIQIADQREELQAIGDQIVGTTQTQREQQAPIIFESDVE